MQLRPTSYTPSVNFDSESKVFEIKGRSFPENAKDFYIPIMEWLNNYIDEPKSEVTFRVNLEYFNTASSKFLLEALYIFEKMHSEEKHVSKVEWVYVEGDEDMKEAGEEFQQIVKVPFAFIQESNN